MSTIHAQDRAAADSLPRCPAHTGRFDLANPKLYSEGEPAPLFDELRKHAPVSWQTIASGAGFWSATRYDDVVLVLRDHARFTSERGTILNILGEDDPAGGKQMAVTDPPKHSRLRRPMQRALSTKAVEAQQSRIRDLVVELIEPLGDGVFDFAQTMLSLPMAVTGTLMGLPSADWPRLITLTTTAIAPDDPDYELEGGPDATLSNAHRELFAYFQDGVNDRRRAPRDDLISYLMEIEADGRKTTPGEIMSNCYSLLLGANVTTPHVASATIVSQAGTGALEDWAAHPELIVSGTEEALRLASPANHFMRYATQDLDLGGAKIRAGDAVVAWLGSANRDEHQFANPKVFDIRRTPNRHVAFGVGAHLCLGHAVARVTLRTLFAELLSRYECFELAGEPERLRSNFIAGYKRLPITAVARKTRGPVAAGPRF